MNRKTARARVTKGNICAVMRYAAASARSAASTFRSAAGEPLAALRFSKLRPHYNDSIHFWCWRRWRQRRAFAVEGIAAPYSRRECLAIFEFKEASVCATCNVAAAAPPPPPPPPRLLRMRTEMTRPRLRRSRGQIMVCLPQGFLTIHPHASKQYKTSAGKVLFLFRCEMRTFSDQFETAS